MQEKNVESVDDKIIINVNKTIMELYIISWRLLGKSIKTHTILDCHLMEGGKAI